MPQMYCHGEARDCPDAEFVLDAQGRYVHRTQHPHYLDGDPAVDPGLDPTAPRLIGPLDDEAEHIQPQQAPEDFERLRTFVRHPQPEPVQREPTKVRPRWPRIDPADKNADELRKLLYQARLDAAKAKYLDDLAGSKAPDDNFEREKADWANEYSQAQAVNSAYLEVAKGNFDRAAARASFVQGAAVAVSGAYAGILAFIYSADKDATPLPAAGVAPTLFFGIAIFLATVYNAYLSDAGMIAPSLHDGTLPDKQRQRRNSFIRWTSAPVALRKDYLHASIISLGMGAIFLPLPFVEMSDVLKWVLVICGLVLIPLLTLLFRTEPPPQQPG